MNNDAAIPNTKSLAATHIDMVNTQSKLLAENSRLRAEIAQVQALRKAQQMENAR